MSSSSCDVRTKHVSINVSTYLTAVFHLIASRGRQCSALGAGTREKQTTRDTNVMRTFVL